MFWKTIDQANKQKMFWEINNNANYKGWITCCLSWRMTLPHRERDVPKGTESQDVLYSIIFS